MLAVGLARLHLLPFPLWLKARGVVRAAIWPHCNPPAALSTALATICTDQQRGPRNDDSCELLAHRTVVGIVVQSVCFY